LYLSAYFEKHRAEYYDRLLAVSQEGAWNEWIQFFLLGVAEQSRDALARAQKLTDLWDSYRERVLQAKGTVVSLRLVDELFHYPALTSARARDRLKVTPRSVQLNLDKLVSAGILREHTGRKRNRIYIAPEIVHIIEADEL
jgi:Fic family protein